MQRSLRRTAHRRPDIEGFGAITLPEIARDDEAWRGEQDRPMTQSPICRDSKHGQFFNRLVSLTAANAAVCSLPMRSGYTLPLTD
jgi:hypothetical protein